MDAVIAWLSELQGWLSSMQAWLSAEANTRLIQNIFYGLSTFGIFAGIFVYMRRSKQDYRVRQDEKYDTLQAWYIDFLKMSFENPELDFSPDAIYTENLTADELYKQNQIFNIFISIIEQAWLLRSVMPKSQWAGWQHYIEYYFSSQIFVNLVDELLMSGTWYDQNFERYLRSLMPKKKTRVSSRQSV